MSEPLHIILDAIPTDDVSFVMNFFSGIIVPFLLLSITWYITKTSREQAMKYAEELRLSDRKHLFSDNMHLAIDNLFKNIQTLRHINLQRKRHEEWAEKTNQNNEKVRSSSINEAIQMQHDLTKWHLDKILDLELQQGTALIDVVSAQTRVQHLLTEKRTSILDEIIQRICSVSKDAGSITEKMIREFINELNNHQLKLVG